MPVPKLTDEQMLQYIRDNWAAVPERKREKLSLRPLKTQYHTVYKCVRHDEYEKEKGEDTYPVYTLKRLLKYKRLTPDDVAEMKRLLDRFNISND